MLRPLRVMHALGQQASSLTTAHSQHALQQMKAICTTAPYAWLPVAHLNMSSMPMSPASPPASMPPANMPPPGGIPPKPLPAGAL